MKVPCFEVFCFTIFTHCALCDIGICGVAAVVCYKTYRCGSEQSGSMSRLNKVALCRITIYLLNLYSAPSR